MRSGQEAARRFHEDPERSSDFLCLPDLEDFLFCLRKKKKKKKASVENCSLSATPSAYISCRISGVPPLQSDFSGLSSALKDDTNEPKKRKETRTKPTKMARKKSTLLVQQIC